MTRSHSRARLALALLFTPTALAQLLPGNAPAKSQPGQSGTNQCGTGSSQTSSCQNAFLNSLDDFCLYAPPEPGAGSTIGNTERIEVSWCTQPGQGTRLIPDGAITGAHVIHTPDFVQVTGFGKLTMINVPAGDEGGELDPHGADGNGNPIGGLVFSSAFGPLQQIKEWTNFMSDSEFCFRACKPGPNAATFCQHIYDVMGCQWNMPGNYASGFSECNADSGEPMGVYGTSTFHQGQAATPAAHPAPASSNCQFANSIGNGFTFTGAPAPTTTTATTSGGTTTTSGGTTTPTGTTSTGATTTGTTTSGTGTTTTSSGGTSSSTSVTGTTSTTTSDASSITPAPTDSGAGTSTAPTSTGTTTGAPNAAIKMGANAWVHVVLTSAGLLVAGLVL